MDLAAAFLGRQKLLACITAAAIALGVAMILVVARLGAELRRGMLRPTHAVDLIVGAPGSEAALAFAALLHVDAPRGNLPLRIYEQIAGMPGVRMCIPICLGDEYRGRRVIGTTLSFFDFFQAGGDRPCEWSAGKTFAADLEVVAGSEAAAATGLAVGDLFHSTHAGADSHKEHALRLVGILKPTGTPNDRALFCNLGTYWRLHQKSYATAGAATAAPPREITALLMRCDGPVTFSLLRSLPQQFGVAAIRPADVLARTFAMVLAPVERILLLHGWALAMVAVTMLALALFVVAQLHVRDMGILRCLGASRGELLRFVAWQSAILLVMGSTLGVVLSRLALWWLREDLLARFGVQIGMWHASPHETGALLAVLGIGIAAGCIPAHWASRRSIDELLEPK